MSLSVFADVPRARLAQLPTPLHPLAQTSEALGVETWIKRDDLTELAMSGNKIRKLEFLLADAKANGASEVITCGGVQSNHCRATALAAAKLGLGCTVMLRTPDPENPPRPQGNVLLDIVAGASIYWVSPREYEQRAQLFAKFVQEAADEGRVCYPIPEGGSSGIGVLGYAHAVLELQQQLPDLADRGATIVHACGSGGTTAGLALGVKLLGLDKVRVVGIPVCDDKAYFNKEIARMIAQCTSRWEVRIDENDYELVDGYVGAGYARCQPAELATQIEFCRREGIVLDPVYTGKAYVGMCQEIAKDAAQFGDRVIFLHTGGTFGAFAYADDLAAAANR